MHFDLTAFYGILIVPKMEESLTSILKPQGIMLFPNLVSSSLVASNMHAMHKVHYNLQWLVEFFFARIEC